MVEDNRGDVVLVEAAIEKAGLPYHVTVASDGAEAVEFLHRRGQHAQSPRPELIMLDLKLPRKNGCEVLDEIRLDPLLGKIPLVLLSSSKSELKRARSYELPPECYLEKPEHLSRASWNWSRPSRPSAARRIEGEATMTPDP